MGIPRDKISCASFVSSFLWVPLACLGSMAQGSRAGASVELSFQTSLYRSFCLLVLGRAKFWFHSESPEEAVVPKMFGGRHGVGLVLHWGGLSLSISRCTWGSCTWTSPTWRSDSRPGKFNFAWYLFLTFTTFWSFWQWFSNSDLLSDKIPRA